MKSFYLFLFLFIAATLQLHAQSLTITVIENETNLAQQNTQVIIENPDIGFSVSRTTSESGRIVLTGLSTSGEYIVRTEPSEAYFESISEPISLISNRNTSVLLIVFSRRTGRLDELTVTARSTTINTVDAQVASEISANEIESIPIEARDISRALYRLPNISQSTGFFPEAPNVAINGANSLFTNYQIDGFDNNENFLGGQRFRIPVGITQNITALTNNFSAEYGRTSNGVINITTLSGSNELSGEVFLMTRPGPPLDASSPFAQRDLSGNQVKDGFARYQVGFSVGGPIVEDQTFFFVNAEHYTDLKDNLLNVPQLGVNETVSGTNHFTFLSGRLDHNWSSRFRSNLRINKGIINIERQGGGIDGGVTFASAGNRQDRNSFAIANRNTYSGNGFVSETGYQYGRFRWNYANPDSDAGPNVTVLAPNGETIALLGHPGFVFDETENTHQLQQKFTFYKGRHTLKAGADFKTSGFALRGGGNPDGSWLVQLSPEQLQNLRNSGVTQNLAPQDLPPDVDVLNFGVELRPDAFKKRQNLIGIYLEDQFSVNSNLNLNLGLRYDYDNLSKAGDSSGDFNNFAPRFSANYRLNDRSSIRAGYGIYYDKILYAVYSDALQFSSNSDDFRSQISLLVNQGILPSDTDIDKVTNEGNLVAGVPSASYLRGPDRGQLQSERESVFSNELRILNPNGLDNPYSHQFMVGFQRQLTSNSLLYVDLMHNRTYNLYRLRDLNAPAAFPIDPQNVEVRTQEEADATRATPIFQDNEGFYTPGPGGERLHGVARSIVMTETKGRSNYYALNLTYDRTRGESDVALRVIYTLSYLENNTEDINFRAMDANNFDAEWGPALNDRRHMIHALVSYSPVNSLSITVAPLIQSGLPINRVADASQYGTNDLNGDGRSFSQQFVGNNDRSPGLSRNSDRLPWSTVFDLNLRYTLDIDDNRFELGADIYNLFNAENLSGFNANLTQSNQIQVGPEGREVRNVSPPRQFQFSVRYLF
ncbi:TonB-dependent receptor plug domain-containing protein [Rhodohalobacter mucosus]|uniref:TonB-dependent receptor n=1 Tax=Rhodohalobacter mucosus TaxID=2079485 RepID=A0A316TQN3_9BACT|nr:TonB-dependent receptor [Rhodohalobacter mucosus]PWN05325.1 TonB-dependent receptor [Rhodohalobacter mucosus]